VKSSNLDVRSKEKDEKNRFLQILRKFGCGIRSKSVSSIYMYHFMTISRRNGTFFAESVEQVLLGTGVKHNRIRRGFAEVRKFKFQLRNILFLLVSCAS